MFGKKVLFDFSSNSREDICIAVWFFNKKGVQLIKRRLHCKCFLLILQYTLEQFFYRTHANGCLLKLWKLGNLRDSCNTWKFLKFTIKQDDSVFSMVTQKMFVFFVKLAIKTSKFVIYFSFCCTFWFTLCFYRLV